MKLREEMLPRELYGWEVITLPDCMHVVPCNDLRVHFLEPTCWCCPEKDDEDSLWKHNSLDGREEYENGMRKPH